MKTNNTIVPSGYLRMTNWVSATLRVGVILRYPEGTIVKFVTCLFFFLTFSSFAQDTLTIEQAIEIALKNNHSILMAKNEANITQNNYTPGNAGMLPQLNFNAGGTWANNNVRQELSNGSIIAKPNAGSTGMNSGIALTWTLFDGMKMFTSYEKLNELNALSEVQLKIQIENTVSTAMNQYYLIVKQNQLVKSLESDLALYKERVSIAQTKFNIGSSAKTDLLQAKVDMNEVQSNFLMQQNTLREYKFALNQTLARSVETSFEVSNNITISYHPKIEDLKKTVSDSNHQLSFYQRNIRINELSLKENQSNYLPKLAANANYNFTQSKNQAGFLLLNQNLGLNAGLTLSWNIFNGGNDARQIQNSKLSIENSKLLFEQNKSVIEISLLKAYLTYNNAKEILKLEEENFNLAKENVEIAIERFRLGSSSTLELKAAQKSFEDAQVRLVNARYNTKTNEIELMRLNGMLVK
jgi:outer membrane protein